MSVSKVTFLLNGMLNHYTISLQYWWPHDVTTFTPRPWW